jgi:hypothetical protein
MTILASKVGNFGEGLSYERSNSAGFFTMQKHEIGEEKFFHSLIRSNRSAIALREDVLSVAAGMTT